MADIHSMEKKGKKGIGAFLFSRTFIFILMVLLQVILILILSYNIADSKIVNRVLMGLQVFLIVYIVNDKSEPTTKLVWAIFIMVLPALEKQQLFFNIKK